MGTYMIDVSMSCTLRGVLLIYKAFSYGSSVLSLPWDCAFQPLCLMEGLRESRVVIYGFVVALPGCFGEEVERKIM